MTMRPVFDGETDIDEIVRSISPDDFLRSGELISRSIQVYVDRLEKKL